MRTSWKKRLMFGAVAVAMAVAVTPATGAMAVEQVEQVEETPMLKRTVFSDTFQNGFDTSAAGNWQLFQNGGLTANDGIATTSTRGLNVVPSGKDPVTGQPAFAWTTGQQAAGGGGDKDHMKWLAYPRHNGTTGYPGYDVPPNGQLTCESSLSVQTRNMERHPFGTAVSDPQGDVRLGSAGLVTADLQTGMVMDFHVTNNTVYAFYERLRYPGTTYAAFTYAVPVARITPGTQVNTQVVLENGGTRARWKLNGFTVLTVNKLGTLELDRKYLQTDHGGTEEVVAPKQATCGLGVFSMLDGAGADGRGLVRLDSTNGFYYNTRLGAPTGQTFLDETSQTGSRIWGQGVDLRAANLKVTTGERL
ncbi:DUF6081 family protein [Streptomyces katrae]|uniref:DUF6081 family protein n=1 Tax=Streptomyces katrae TaxID=68223 RepID=A0ABT7GWZ7_9ACTN|nr:DUF6081 family protein [Streptomyces katrae]MDK9497419.1 DUF6081 family protein [Streptomyces katrae]